MDRRDFLKIGSGLAALVAGAACNISSNGGNGPDPDPDPSVPYYFGLYDNFEGGWKSNLWRGSADIVNDNGNNVAKIVKDGSGTRNITMDWPYEIPVEHFEEWSARVKVPSTELNTDDFMVGLDYHGLAPEGLSWFAQIRIMRLNGYVSIAGQCKNRSTGWTSWVDMPAEIDKWYDLKMQVDVDNENSKVDFKFYVNGTYLGTVTPPEEESNKLRFFSKKVG